MVLSLNYNIFLLLTKYKFYDCSKPRVSTVRMIEILALVLIVIVGSVKSTANETASNNSVRYKIYLINRFGNISFQMQMLENIKQETLELLKTVNLTDNFVENAYENINQIKEQITNMSSAAEAQFLHARLDTVTESYLSIIKAMNSTLESFRDQVHLVKLFALRLGTETSRKINGEEPFPPLIDQINSTKQLDLLYARHVGHTNPEQQLRSFYHFKNYY